MDKILDATSPLEGDKYPTLNLEVPVLCRLQSASTQCSFLMNVSDTIQPMKSQFAETYLNGIKKRTQVQNLKLAL
jgi:hypothetical protein